MSNPYNPIDRALEHVAQMRADFELSDMMSRIVDYIHPVFVDSSSDVTVTVTKKRRGNELHLRLPDPELRALESLLRDGETPCIAIRRLISEELLRKAGVGI
jgi:hypothetical protein